MEVIDPAYQNAMLLASTITNSINDVYQIKKVHWEGTTKVLVILKQDIMTDEQAKKIETIWLNNGLGISHIESQITTKPIFLIDFYILYPMDNIKDKEKLEKAQIELKKNNIKHRVEYHYTNW